MGKVNEQEERKLLLEEVGPLAALVGTWRGDKGMDVAPEPDGADESPYYETIIISPGGKVDNAEEQDLLFLHYHQVVRRKSNDEIFHNESGYYSLEPATGIITQSFSIPRGVAVVAGGKFHQLEKDLLEFEVKAKAGDTEFGIAESAFMARKASTQSFHHQIRLKGDELWYQETTVVDIYGKRFDHTDTNTLSRVR